MSDRKRTRTASDGRDVTPRLMTDAEPASARARLARFIAAILSEPDAEFHRRIIEPAVMNDVRAACAALGIDGALLDPIVEGLSDAAGAAECYGRLLGHAVRGECPPYELEYRAAEVFQQSQTLADIAGFFRAFGFDAAGPFAERADHAATQWEFLAVLAMKESQARRVEDRECCIDAQRAFLADHAAAWMPAFFERLRRADAASLLARGADLAEVVLREWCERHHVPVGPKWLALRPISDEDGVITCGAGGEVELGPTLSAAMSEGHE